VCHNCLQYRLKFWEKWKYPYCKFCEAYVCSKKCMAEEKSIVPREFDIYVDFK
jgi:hypothetical protein